ncbi:uncharacterized protein LOC144994319 isoform X1 [Oryzias latipes]
MSGIWRTWNPGIADLISQYPAALDPSVPIWPLNLTISRRNNWGGPCPKLGRCGRSTEWAVNPVPLNPPVLIVVCAITGQEVTIKATSDNVLDFSFAASTITSDTTATSEDTTAPMATQSNTYSSTPTKSEGGESTTQDKVSQTAGSTESTTMSPLSPPHSSTSPTPPSGPVESKKPTTGANNNDKITVSPTAAAGEKTGIIILIVLIIVVFAFGAACFFARGRGRHHSIDLTSRPDEVNVPLSAVEAESPPDTEPEKDMQTFQSSENPAKEEEIKPEAQEEQKVEADKPSVDPSAESAAPAANSSDDKPKEDVVENNSPAPVEASAEEKTDDEGLASNKTSVESLKETNENNSNNVGLCHRGETPKSLILLDVCLDSPV